MKERTFKAGEKQYKLHFKIGDTLHEHRSGSSLDEVPSVVEWHITNAVNEYCSSLMDSPVMVEATRTSSLGVETRELKVSILINTGTVFCTAVEQSDDYVIQGLLDYIDELRRDLRALESGDV